MDQGSLGSSFSKVTSYTNNGMTHTVRTVPDGIVPGSIYTFKFRAVNVIDPSNFSPETRIAAASPPSKPATPTRALILNSKTQITVLWSQSANNEIPIQGYRLYMSSGTGVYTMIYNGFLNPL
jgi:hypothetical protein